MAGFAQGRSRLLNRPQLDSQRAHGAARNARLPELHTTPRGDVRAQAGEDNPTREPWDFGRFVQTAVFFANPLTMAQRIVGKVASTIRPDSTPVEDAAYTTLAGTPAEAGRPAVLVLGATGGTGVRVVQRLLARGERVRALVRDTGKAAKTLGALPLAAGAVLEVAAADLSQPATVLPELFEDVRRAVSCTGTVVRPQGSGDDPEGREQYLQGIKFYQPSLAKDTPDAVERDGMRAVLKSLVPQLGVKEGVPILDTGSVESRWGPLDDVVMGGVSQSGLYRVRGAGPAGQDVAVFRGNVSVANNGGFASVRSRNWEPALDLGAYEGLRVTLRGDGKRYKFILRCSGAWDSVCYCLSVDTPKGEWTTLDLPFADFMPVFRAKIQPDAPPLDPSRISSAQFMLSKFEYDGALNPHFSAGLFELPIAQLAAYIPHSAPARFVHVSSAGVTRPNRPGINLEEETPPVRMNDMLGGLMTYKLAGEDLVRESGVPFAVVRPTSLTEEPGGMPLSIEQGDTIRGKISREDVADLCVSLLSSPVAANTTFEVGSTLVPTEDWTGATEADQESPQEGPGRDWDVELRAADLKQGVTGKTVNGVYTGTQPEEAAAAKGEREIAAA
eukprot:jgi/Ulvmu1/12437/UM009_0089.1